MDSGQFQLNLAPFQVKTVLDKVFALHRPLAVAKRITFTTSFSSDFNSLNVEGDAMRVRQILCNILSNAIKVRRD